MQRAWQVLHKFNAVPIRIDEPQIQITVASLIYLGRNFHTLFFQIDSQSLNVSGLQSNVGKPILFLGRQAREDLNELPIIHFEVGEQKSAVVIEDSEGFLISQQFPVKPSCLGQVTHLKSNVSDTDNWRPVDRQGGSRRQNRPKEKDYNQETFRAWDAQSHKFSY